MLTGNPPGPRPPDRRHQRRWVPITAAWLSLLIGLADIIEVVRPSLYESALPSRLHLHPCIPSCPGALTNVTHTVEVIIGLMLLMLSHALRRRKRRAWEAVTVLLAVSVVVHFTHFHFPRIATGVVSVLLLAALLYYRDEFYAVGDPRTRWRALWVFCGLVIADVAIGLTYILLAKGLAKDYSLWQRIVHVVYGLVGVSGPVQFVPESRADLFNLLTGALGLFTLLVTAYLFFRPARPPGGWARRTRRKSGSCWPSRATGTRSATSRCAATRASSGPRPASPASATGWCPGSCWPAVTRSATRRRGPARSTRSSTRRPGTPGCPR